ncbi:MULTISPECIES: DUF4197 domain-containing protein [unclassified Iodidimonas]|uniref:DUF4197 domain-containing protein n=1 Tax=unclassified Iodidimonas TaxID=2626145 RepID=UPI002483177C|nr:MULTISPECIES: DUF4197 domain-containing protein [unclassified Iodidimonas]
MNFIVLRLLPVFVLALSFMAPAFTPAFALEAGQSLLDRSKAWMQKSPSTSSFKDLTDSDMTKGLLEALSIATDRTVSKLGAAGGYLENPSVHIPLPRFLGKVDKALGRIGQNDLTQDLEIRLNRAAEAAAPAGRALFMQAIADLSIKDAKAIITGPDDAATRYFKAQMSPELSKAMHPIIEGSLRDVGAIALYDKSLETYGDIPFMPDVKGDLIAYSTEKAMDGLFHTLAIEEAAIRADPLKRGSVLLQKIFGAP